MRTLVLVLLFVLAPAPAMAQRILTFAPEREVVRRSLFAGRLHGSVRISLGVDDLVYQEWNAEEWLVFTRARQQRLLVREPAFAPGLPKALTIQVALRF